MDFWKRPGGSPGDLAPGADTPEHRIRPVCRLKTKGGYKAKEKSAIRLSRSAISRRSVASRPRRAQTRQTESGRLSRCPQIVAAAAVAASGKRTKKGLTMQH